jgi:periplasmic copper chaperone A
MSRVLSAAGLAAILLAASPAFAHVELQTDKAPAASSFKAVLMVPHGCAGSPTVGLRVQVPDGVIGTKPMAKPGWKIVIKTAKLAQPIDIEGEKTTEAVKEIDWAGGNLPDSFYDEFAFVATLPDRPGTVIYFPAIQQCAKGETRWIEIPAAGQNSDDLKAPAPSLTLGPKGAGGD